MTDIFYYSMSDLKEFHFVNSHFYFKLSEILKLSKKTLPLVNDEKLNSLKKLNYAYRNTELPQ